MNDITQDAGSEAAAFRAWFATYQPPAGQPAHERIYCAALSAWHARGARDAEERSELRDVAVWLVKNWDEWSDAPLGSGAFKVLANTVERLRAALQPEPVAAERSEEGEGT